jgi:hypothetical protein
MPIFSNAVFRIGSRPVPNASFRPASEIVFPAPSSSLISRARIGA